jgi:hypothetical protein
MSKIAPKRTLHPKTNKTDPTIFKTIATNNIHGIQGNILAKNEAKKSPA